MKKIIYLFFTAIIFLAAACDKEEEPWNAPLPHKVFGCKDNGEDWIPSTGGGATVIDPFKLAFYPDSKTVELFAQSNDTRTAITIFSDSTSIGINSIVDNNNFHNFSDGNLESNCRKYIFLNKHFPNFFNVISIDSISYNLQAEFELSCSNSCGDTVYITEGYLDLNYTF